MSDNTHLLVYMHIKLLIRIDAAALCTTLFNLSFKLQLGARSSQQSVLLNRYTQMDVFRENLGSWGPGACSLSLSVLEMVHPGGMDMPLDPPLMYTRTHARPTPFNTDVYRQIDTIKGGGSCFCAHTSDTHTDIGATTIIFI